MFRIKTTAMSETFSKFQEDSQSALLLAKKVFAESGADVTVINNPDGTLQSVWAIGPGNRFQKCEAIPLKFVEQYKKGAVVYEDGTAYYFHCTYRNDIVRTKKGVKTRTEGKPHSFVTEFPKDIYTLKDVANYYKGGSSLMIREKYFGIGTTVVLSYSQDLSPKTYDIE